MWNGPGRKAGMVWMVSDWCGAASFGWVSTVKAMARSGMARLVVVSHDLERHYLESLDLLEFLDSIFIL